MLLKRARLDCCAAVMRLRADRSNCCTLLRSDKSWATPQHIQVLQTWQAAAVTFGAVSAVKAGLRAALIYIINIILMINVIFFKELLVGHKKKIPGLDIALRWNDLGIRVLVERQSNRSTAEVNGDLPCEEHHNHL